MKLHGSGAGASARHAQCLISIAGPPTSTSHSGIAHRSRVIEEWMNYAPIKSHSSMDESSALGVNQMPPTTHPQASRLWDISLCCPASTILSSSLAICGHSSSTTCSFAKVVEQVVAECTTKAGRGFEGLKSSAHLGGCDLTLFTECQNVQGTAKAQKSCRHSRRTTKAEKEVTDDGAVQAH